MSSRRCRCRCPPTTTETFTNGIPLLNDFTRSGNLSNFFSALGGQTAILDVPSFSATLRFLNEDADAEFLANPRIVTADNLEATIKIVRNQPVPQLNFNEQTATAVFGGFQDKIYGNTLVVKPSINKDNFITLSVKPEISNHVGDETFDFAGAAVTSPIIDTRTLESNVLIKSGCTLAIGGLLQDESNKATTKVPILGDIPILGYLFQEHLNSRTKRNLLIFVTPTIINQQYGTGLEDQINGLKASSGNEMADINGWRNNAKGAIRLKKTPYKQLASEYPAPGDCNTKQVTFKETVHPNDQYPFPSRAGLSRLAPIRFQAARSPGARPAPAAAAPGFGLKRFWKAEGGRRKAEGGRMEGRDRKG